MADWKTQKVFAEGEKESTLVAEPLSHLLFLKEEMTYLANKEGYYYPDLSVKYGLLMIAKHKSRKKYKDHRKHKSIIT